MIYFPEYCITMQDLPTSFPAPNGVMDSLELSVFIVIKINYGKLSPKIR